MVDDDNDDADADDDDDADADADDDDGELHTICTFFVAYRNQREAAINTMHSKDLYFDIKVLHEKFYCRHYCLIEMLPLSTHKI